MKWEKGSRDFSPEPFGFYLVEDGITKQNRIA
jgi:hypothetical protein